MRHVILTCELHPELRWSTKEIAVTDGRYNGTRNLFFMGEPVRNKDGTPKMHADGSGLECTELVQGGPTYRLVRECTCPSGYLTVAPEDKLVKSSVFMSRQAE